MVNIRQLGAQFPTASDSQLPDEGIHVSKLQTPPPWNEQRARGVDHGRSRNSHDVIRAAVGASGVTTTRASDANLAAGGPRALNTSRIPKILRGQRSTHPIDRGSAHAEREAGVFANYLSPEVHGIPTQLPHMGGGFCLYDSGGGSDRIVLFGADPNMRAPRGAPVWFGDWASKVRPELWAKSYEIRAVSPGYCIHCIYDLLHLRYLLGKDADGDAC